MDPTTPPATTLPAYFLKMESILRDRLAASVGQTPFRPEHEDADLVQVERGVMFAELLLEPSRAKEPVNSVERLIAMSIPATIERVSVVDRAGHTRPVYRPLLIYSWLQAFRLGYEQLPRSEFGRWEEACRAWCDDLESRLGAFDWPTQAIPAASGDQVATICWIALTLHLAGKVFIRDAWTDLAADVFGKLASRQQPNGAFLLAGVSDNLETHGFHELVLLHAASSYAVQAEDRSLARCVVRATNHHQAETQPDHSTSQPWSLFAFLWNSDTHSTGEAILHACTQPGISQSELTLMLLADALYCLRLFKI